MDELISTIILGAIATGFLAMFVALRFRARRFLKDAAGAAAGAATMTSTAFGDSGGPVFSGPDGHDGCGAGHDGGHCDGGH